MLRPGEPRGSAVLSREKRQAKENWQATNLGGSKHWGNKCKSTNETVAAGARPRRLRRRPRACVEQICGGSRSVGSQGESCGGAKHHCGSSFCAGGRARPACSSDSPLARLGGVLRLESPQVLVNETEQGPSAAPAAQSRDSQVESSDPARAWPQQIPSTIPACSDSLHGASRVRSWDCVLVAPGKPYS